MSKRMGVAALLGALLSPLQDGVFDGGGVGGGLGDGHAPIPSDPASTDVVTAAVSPGLAEMLGVQSQSESQGTGRQAPGTSPNPSQSRQSPAQPSQGQPTQAPPVLSYVPAPGPTPVASGGASPDTLRLVQETQSRAVEAERTRTRTIMDRAGWPVFSNNAQVQSLAQQAVRDGLSPDEFGVRAMALLAPAPMAHVGNDRGHTPSLQLTRDQRDTGVNAASLAMFVRLNPGVESSLDVGAGANRRERRIASETAKALGFATPSAALQAIAQLGGNQVQGVSLLGSGGSPRSLAIRCIAAAEGISVADAFEMFMSNQGATMRILAGAGQHTTSDFPNILSNLANKTLMAAFARQGTVWQEFCPITPVYDYKSAPILALGEGGIFKARGGGENSVSREQTVQEFRETAPAAVGYDSKVSWTYEMMRNDDLGAFNSLVQVAGEKSALIPENLFMAALAANSYGGLSTGDGFTLFNLANHQNLGTPAALSYDAIWANIKRVRKIRDQAVDVADRDYLDVNPEILFCASDDEDVATDILTQDYKPSSGAASLMQRNTLKGRLRLVTTPRIDSANGFYLACAAGPKSAVEMRFVDGVQTPQVFRIDAENPWAMTYQLVLRGVAIAMRPRYYGLQRVPRN